MSAISSALSFSGGSQATQSIQQQRPAQQQSKVDSDNDYDHNAPDANATAQSNSGSLDVIA